MKIKNKSYELVIQPHRSWFYFDWEGLLHHRDLLFLLVRRDFVAKYKQTILGPLWFILQPLLTTVIFTIVFKKGLKVSTDGLPPFLFYFCALVPWSYFAQCVTSISMSLTANANLFGKVYFPRLIVPAALVLSNLIPFFIQLITFLCFYAYFKFLTPLGELMDFNRMTLFLPLLLFQVAATAFGVGLWVAAFTVKYRDFQHLMTFVTQLWMYATPVIYPASIIPEGLRHLLAYNPMSGIVESFRYAFFGVGYVRFDYLLTSALISLVVLITGILIFNRAERNFVDTI